jgi:hypothetical protein
VLQFGTGTGRQSAAHGAIRGRGRRADIDMNALQLRLESDEASAAIPLEEKNLFTLPATHDPLHAKADLTLIHGSEYVIDGGTIPTV